MTLPSISRLARAAVYQRLADPTTGFNPRFQASVLDAGLVAPSGQQFTINFGANSRNFFQANLLPADLDVTTAFTSPYMTLFGVQMQHKNLEKFGTFAGPVRIGINYFIVWKGTGAFNNMELPGDCFEEAIFGAFNAPENAEWAHTFNPSLDYNGEITLKRSAVKIDSTDWLQGFYAFLDLDMYVGW